MNDYKAMGWGKSLLLFSLPGLAMTLNMRIFLPLLLEQGLSFPLVVFAAIWLPVILMVIYVLHRWKVSGRKFGEYFWVTPLCRKCLTVTFLAFIVVQVGELALEPTRGFLSRFALFSAPDFYPSLFKPDYAIELPLIRFFGMEVMGNPLVFLYWFFWIVVNIGGEELLWRGYALPRMEAYFGKYAWLVNGLLWNLVVHSFMPWSWITLLPISLIVPFMSQKTKSLWPGIIIHGLGNLLVYAILIPSV